jgi:hypothetical protein
VKYQDFIPMLLNELMDTYPLWNLPSEGGQHAQDTSTIFGARVLPPLRRPHVDQKSGASGVIVPTTCVTTCSTHR